MPVAWAASRWVESMLFGLTAADPVSAVATIGALAATAALATLVPARQAARLDPLTILRRE
jgi:ABC-type lipoprotein release transport system permease subunit